MHNLQAITDDLKTGLLFTGKDRNSSFELNNFDVFVLYWLKVKIRSGKVKHELRVQLYELRVQVHELRVQIHELRVQINKLIVQIHELRVQIHELGD